MPPMPVIAAIAQLPLAAAFHATVPAPCHFFGLSSGNNITSRIDSAPVNNIANRSMPMPKPPAGGIPCSSASKNSSSIFCVSSPACSCKR